MKFTVATLLLVTAFAAVALGSICWYSSFIYRSSIMGFLHSNDESLWLTLRGIVLSAPTWLPFAFAGYAIGRKRITLPFVVALGCAQIAAAGFTYAVVTAMRK